MLPMSGAVNSTEMVRKALMMPGASAHPWTAACSHPPRPARSLASPAFRCLLCAVMRQQSQWGPSSHHAAEWLQPMSLLPTRSLASSLVSDPGVLSFHRSSFFGRGRRVCYG